MYSYLRVWKEVTDVFNSTNGMNKTSREIRLLYSRLTIKQKKVSLFIKEDQMSIALIK